MKLTSEEGGMLAGAHGEVLQLAMQHQLGLGQRTGVPQSGQVDSECLVSPIDRPADPATPPRRL